IEAYEEITPGFLTAGILELRDNNALAGTRKDRAARYYPMKRLLCPERLSNVITNISDMCKIQTPIPLTGRSHRNERNIGLRNGGTRVLSGRDQIALARLGEHFLQTRFYNGSHSCANSLDLQRVRIHADHAMPF